MPYINVKTTASITKENKMSLTEKLGQAISILPGKSEAHLMLCFEGELDMYFKGERTNPTAFVDVKIFGKCAPASYAAFTAEVTKIISAELSVEPSRIFIAYGEFENWGWNGTNL